MMNQDDKALTAALSQLSQASDISASEQEEVARVKKARANVTEQARKSGDNAGNLLSNLLGESNAELEAEEEERKRKIAESQDKERQQREAEEEKKRLAAEKLLQEEKKRLEEIEKRRLQMLADLEKKRKADAGEVDEEEEERKRLEAEAEAQRKANEAAREREEQERLAAMIRENQAKLDLLKPKPVDPEVARRAQRKKRLLIGAGAAALILAIGSPLAYYFLTKKAPDFYVLAETYPTGTLELETIPAVGFTGNEFAKREVIQEAPKLDTRSSGRGTRSNSGKDAKDQYGIGRVVDVTSTSTIVH